MRPFDECVRVFAEHGADFSAAVARNLNDGFLFSTPDFFIMGREIGGAWFIEGMAGDCAKAWSILPYELPTMTFERFDGDLRSLPLCAVKRLTYHEQTHVS